MKKICVKILFVIIFWGASTPIPVFSVEIINNISSSASSGGNESYEGKIIEGENKAEIKIYTEINGEVIENYESSKVSNEGEDVVVERSVEINLPDLNSNTEIKIKPKSVVNNTITQNKIEFKEVASTNSEEVEVERLEKAGRLFTFLSNIFEYVFNIF